MTTTAAPALPRYRFLGVTDERVTCEACGKTELRSTVVLRPLDAEGNDEGDPVYFGSTCAAYALRTSGNGAKVLVLARNAHERLRDDARRALEFLAFVGVDVQGRPMQTREDGARTWGCAARRYRMANPLRHLTPEQMAARACNQNVLDVQESVARKLVTINDALALGIIQR